MSSKKVFLYFREFNLGALSNKMNIYIWTPFAEQIKSSKQRYPVAMDLFLLPEERIEIFDKIPNYFNIFLKNCDREDLKINAKINDNDGDFEKLYKMSKLKYFNQDFVIKDK